MEANSDQISQQIKRTLENLPRYGYKAVRFFEDKSELQKAIDFLYNNGIMDINSRTLTQNYIEEIYEKYIFMPKEGLYTFLGGAAGAAIGAIIGWRQGNGLSSFTLLNPISAAGPAASTILCAGILGILGAAFAAVLILFKPIKKVLPGHHMLTVFGDSEKKKEINDMLNTFHSIKDL